MLESVVFSSSNPGITFENVRVGKGLHVYIIHIYYIIYVAEYLS